jgi:hypothetical protein
LWISVHKNTCPYVDHPKSDSRPSRRIAGFETIKAEGVDRSSAYSSDSLGECPHGNRATSEKDFESEGAILERALTKCIRDRQAALKDLADAARRVDKAAFGQQAYFGPSHQALLKALDRAADFI